MKRLVTEKAWKVKKETKAFALCVAGISLLLLCVRALAQAPQAPQAPQMPQIPPTEPTEQKAQSPARTARASKSGAIKLSFRDMPLDMVLEEYSEKVGRVLLRSPKLPTAKITLRSQEDLAMEEYLDAIEHILSMNGVSLVPVGDKFLKVVPSTSVLEEPMPIRGEEEETPLEEKGKIVSQMITLQNIEPAEAEKAIGPLRHQDFGKIHYFEGINSMLITDTEASIKRILDIIQLVDKPPSPAREVPNIMVIHYAKAEDIKKKLEEIVKNAQEEEQKATAPRQRTSGPPGAVAGNPSIPGVIRARMAQTSEPEITSLIAEAERGVIRGEVRIVADDRTNILIIITRPENMTFFEKIVKVLDVETAPDVVVRVIRLEYAEAETVAGMLNQLIGKKESKDQGKPVAGGAGTEEGKSVGLNEYVSRRDAAKPQGAATEEQKTKIGELSSENIKILPNKRTNSLIIMASKSEMTTLEGIIKDMDMVLSQVLIEAVILEIQLGGSIQTGIDWIQRSMIAYNAKQDGSKKPKFSYAGGGGSGEMSPLDATSLQSVPSLASVGSGLTYYFTHFGLNLDAVLQMASGDNRTRIISSPVIVTHDNTEATIDSSEERYFYKGKRWVGSSTSDGRYEDDVEQRKVGLHLTVTPHINEKKLVVMEIAQKIEQLSDGQTIGENTWPTVLARELKASISVQSKETIVLGGLVKQQQGSARRGIPFFSRLPLIGWIFGYKKSEKLRSEVIVFITPYVLNSTEEIAEESERRKGVLDAGGLWQKGWSDSKLAEPVNKKSTFEKDEEAGEKEEETNEPKTPSVPVVKKLETMPVSAVPASVEAPAKEIPAGKQTPVEAESTVKQPELTEKPVNTDVNGQTAPVSGEKKDLDLDPELERFINEEGPKWDNTLDKVDKRLESEVKKREQADNP